MVAGEVEAEAAGQLADAAIDLEQAQGVELDLGGLTEALDQPAAEGVQQPVGGGMQQQTELVGPEARPRRPRRRPCGDPGRRSSNRTGMQPSRGCSGAGEAAHAASVAVQRTGLSRCEPASMFRCPWMRIPQCRGMAETPGR